MIQNEMLILVDEKDQEIGVMEKIKTHQLGLLHRAFSIFILNSKGELLLQQRALSKYHSAGLWSNTCCSHPLNGETVVNAALRRLKQEMGMEVALHPIYSFIYKANFENGLVEHEYDHVLIGLSDDLPIPNVSEVANWRYMALDDLKHDLEGNGEEYSVWLQICFPAVFEILTKSVENQSKFKS